MVAPANDINKLMVMVEANTRSYERAMKKLEGVTNKAARQSAKSFNPLKKSLKEIETGSGRVGARVKRMERELTAAAAKSVAPLKLNNAQLQNMQFQINDLAQGLATGNQSPFTLIAQQGSQIAQIFGPGASLQSAFKSTGLAITSFITNPINLAVIGIAGAAAVVPILWEAFTGPDAKSAEDRLTDINELLNDIEESNKAAADAARAFINAIPSNNSLLIQLRSISQETEIALASANKQLQNLVMSAGYQFGAWSSEVEDARLSLEDYFKEVQDGERDVSDLVVLLEGIILNPSASESVKAFAENILVAANEAATLEAQLNGVAEAARLINNPLTIEEQRAIINGSSIDPARFGGDPVNRSIINDINERNPPRTQRGSKAGRRTEREQEAALRLIDSLQTELSLIGATDLARAQANATRNLGASVTAEQATQIETLTETLHREQEAWQAAQDAQDLFSNAAYDSLMSLVDGSMSAEDAVKRLARTIGEAALQAAFLGQGPLAGIFGTGASGGIFGSLFAGVLGRGGGGNVSAGRPYLIGERGPELFIPATAGKVAANQNIKNMGNTYSPVYNIYAQGADAGAVARIERGLVERDRTEAKRVQGIVSTTRTRGLRG